MKKSFFASFFVSKKVREYRQEGWMVVRKMWPWWGECLFASFSALAAFHRRDERKVSNSPFIHNTSKLTAYEKGTYSMGHYCNSCFSCPSV